MSRISGFALSTAMSISEIVDLLKTVKIPITDFDALICGSGSEVYYPGTAQCTNSDGRFCADPDYATHIEYRWDKDGVQRTIVKLIARAGADEVANIEVDEKSGNAHCAAFFIKDPSKVHFQNLTFFLILFSILNHAIALF
jgi:sucrose-phosphate synthase